MKNIFSLLIICCLASCAKEDVYSNGAVLVRVTSPGDQLANTIVTLRSDSLLSAPLHIMRELSCGADNAAYFDQLPTGWYRVQARGYSNIYSRYQTLDTLFPVCYRTGQNFYEIELVLK
jgi:hypothetical protein